METVTKKPAGRATANTTGRTRAYYGYSRNGCSRCKQQRVRCDEQHPECDRCVRVGVTCPGYEQKLRWSAKHEVFRPEQIGQKKQVRRKAAQTQQTPSLAPSQNTSETSEPSLPSVATQPRAPAQPKDKQGSTPRSIPSPTSSDGIQQQPLPSPMGTATTYTSPTTQLTPQQSSPEPDIVLQQSTSPVENDPLNVPKNPAWFNLFDQIVPPVSADMPDMFMGMNNSFMTDRKSVV